MSPRKPRRCHWYEDDGTPRPSSLGKGCTRRDCTFVHPSDSDWKWATSSLPPPGYEARPAERERDYPIRIRRTVGYPPNEVTTYTTISSAGSSDKPGMSSLRKASIDSISSRTESRDKLSPSTSRTVSNDPRDRSRIVGSSGSGNDLRGVSAERREESRSERRSSTTESGRSEKDERKLDGRKDSVSSIGRVSSSKSETMPPPATKPPTRPEAAKKEDSVLKADRIDVWVSRIKEMASGVSARIQYLKLEDDIVALRRMCNSRQMRDFSEESRRRVEKQRDEAEAALKAKRDELNSIVWRLVDADFWPVPPRLEDSKLSNPSEEKFKEVRLTVWELKDKVKELSEMVQSQKARAVSVLKDSSKPNSRLSTPILPPKQTTAVQVDEPRPAKRRRLSDDKERPAEGFIQADAVSSNALEALDERLISLEGRLADIENDMVQFDHDLEDRIEERLANLNINPASSSGQSENQPETLDTGQVSQEVQNKLRELEAGFMQAGSEIEEVAGEIASIITHMTAIDGETARLIAENEMMKQQVIALEERQIATDKLLEAQTQELKALNTALSMYMARPPDPVPPPVLPDMQTIVEALRPSLIASVREEISPMLQSMRQEVERILQNHTQELSGTVMAKLVVVLRTQAAIQEFMEKAKHEHESGALTPMEEVAPPPHANGVPNGLSPTSDTQTTNDAGPGHIAEAPAPS